MSAFDAVLADDLLARARVQDRSAQESIYRLYERGAYTLARRMTGCPDTAYDITQDSFLKAFDRLPQFRGEAPFGRWLRAIVASEALMHLRSGRRFLELFEMDTIEDQQPSVEDVSNADLEKALNLLPEMPRAVLWLYHVEGYTHPEIADLCGKTVSFSKSQLARAHQKLRGLLDPGGSPSGNGNVTHLPARPASVPRSASP